MKRQVLGWLGIVAVIALVISLMVNVLFFGMLFGGREGTTQVPRPFDQVLVQSAATPTGRTARIAQIDVTGIIDGSGFTGGSSMVDDIRRALEQAVEDWRIRAIVLRIDSPGGEVTASDTIYQAVKAAAARKPVIAYLDAMAASGGYYIACGAGSGRIIANPNTWTGSIGVVVQSLGYGGLMDKTGLKLRVFRSGEFKDSFYGHREMTPAEEKYVQGLVMQTYERFLGIVSEARGIPADDLRNGVADGRVVSGVDAVAHRLVDRTGYLEDAWQAAREAAGVEDAEVVRLTKPASLLSLESLFGVRAAGGIPERVEIDLSDRLLPRLQPGRCYLLPGFLMQ